MRVIQIYDGGSEHLVKSGFREQKTKTAKYKITENGFEVG